MAAQSLRLIRLSSFFMFSFEEAISQKVSSEDLAAFFRLMDAIPDVVDTVNYLTKSKPARIIGDKVGGVHKDAWLPTFNSKTFEKNAKKIKH